MPEGPTVPEGEGRPSPAPRVPSNASDTPPAERAALHVPAGDRRRRGDAGRGVAAAHVRVPTASTLPDPLALQRALRPLQGFHSPSPPGRGMLDEKATVHRAAETGVVQPVLRPAHRREARAQLLMDVSSSTAVWEQTLDELRETFLRCGAFREVRVHYLHEDQDGAPGISTDFRPPTSPLPSPAQLTDPTGRQLTLLLSDCAGPMWRSGAMHRLLHCWAAAMPVAVVQPLPQRMWRSTHLPARPGLLLRPERQAGRLEFVSAGDRPPRTVPVPVLALHHVSMGAWARMLSGAGQLTQRAAAAWVGPGMVPAAKPAGSAAVPASERVRVFRLRRFSYRGQACPVADHNPAGTAGHAAPPACHAPRERTRCPRGSAPGRPAHPGRAGTRRRPRLRVPRGSLGRTAPQARPRGQPAGP